VAGRVTRRWVGIPVLQGFHPSTESTRTHCTTVPTLTHSPGNCQAMEATETAWALRRGRCIL